MGQGALILEGPANISSPFFLLVPDWAQLPLVVPGGGGDGDRLAGGDPGAFSVASQASRLGYLPRLRIIHTSAERIGQIYVPCGQLGADGRGGHAGLLVPQLVQARATRTGWR